MKLVQNLPEIFEEFGEKKREAFLEIKEYKDKGIPVSSDATTIEEARLEILHALHR